MASEGWWEDFKKVYGTGKNVYEADKIAEGIKGMNNSTDPVETGKSFFKALDGASSFMGPYGSLVGYPAKAGGDVLDAGARVVRERNAQLFNAMLESKLFTHEELTAKFPPHALPSDFSYGGFGGGSGGGRGATPTWQNNSSLKDYILKIVWPND